MCPLCNFNRSREKKKKAVMQNVEHLELIGIKIGGYVYMCIYVFMCGKIMDVGLISWREEYKMLICE